MKRVGQIRASDVRELLKADPYSGSSITHIDEDDFYENVYFESEEANRTRIAVVDMMNANIPLPLLIYGYSGCGKTVFVHSLKRSLKNYTVKIFDFGKVYDPEIIEGQKLKSIKGKIIEELINSILKSNGNKLISASFEFMSKNYHLISSINNYGKIYRIIKQINENFKNPMEIDERIDFIESIRDSFDALSLIELLLFDFLLDLSNKIKNNNNNCYLIIYDNFDNISTADLNEFVEQFIVFYDLAATFIKRLDYENCPTIGCAFDYIITLRETTAIHLKEHYQEREAWDNHKINFEDLKDEAKIVEKKYEYFKEYLTPEQTNTFSFANELMKDSYMKNYFSNLFNHSFRYIANTVASLPSQSMGLYLEITRLGKQLYNVACEELNHYYDVANGIILKSILNSFVYRGVFDHDLSLLNFYNSNCKYDVSVARMILTYLSNNSNYNNSFYDILKAFDGIFELEDVRSVVEQMYSMRNGAWGHLITLVESKKHSLNKELEMYKNGNGNAANYSKWKITPAGETFLSKISIHFEFYSARLNCNDYSCHIISIGECFTKKDENGKLLLETMIEDVLKNVKKCYKRLTAFDQNVRKIKDINDLNEYKNSCYLYNSQTHKERIIFRHIGYLNSLRFYLLNQIKNDTTMKTVVNKIIVKAIDEYLKLVEAEPDNERCNSKSVYEQLRKQIITIEISNYKNFKANITVASSLQ